MNELSVAGQQRVAPSEWRWVLVWAVVALVLANLPYLLGALLSTPSMVFGGAVYGVQDVNSYFAKMRQGVRGAWLFHIPYTAEPHPGTIIYIFYLLLGKVSRLTGLSIEAVYHLARLACGVFLLFTAYGFVAYYTPYRAVRRIAFLLIVFSSGLGWLMTLAGTPAWLGTISLDFISPEAYTFLTLYSPPHLALATGCLLWGMLCVADGSERGDWRVVLLGTGAFFVLALIGAFYLLVPFAVLGGHWLLRAVRERRLDWRALGWIAVAMLPVVAILLYDLYYFVFDPVYSVWAAQNLVPALHPLHYVAGYHVVALLAAIGVWRAITRRQWEKQLPVLWLLLVPALLLAPFSAARRLIIGAQVPLCLLAAEGWIHDFVLPFGRSFVVRRLAQHRRYTRAGMRRWITAALILVVFPTNLLLVLGSCVQVAQQEAPIYHSQSELEVLDWLGTHTQPSDTVLCAFETGNYVPARAGNRVLLGLGPETIFADRKRQEVRRFFARNTEHRWRKELLVRYDIAYVLVGPAERALGPFDPDTVPYLDLVYANDTYSVYRVRGEQ